jgi:hypothetical protein
MSYIHMEYHFLLLGEGKKNLNCGYQHPHCTHELQMSTIHTIPVIHYDHLTAIINNVPTRIINESKSSELTCRAHECLS